VLKKIESLEGKEERTETAIIKDNKIKRAPDPTRLPIEWW